MRARGTAEWSHWAAIAASGALGLHLEQKGNKITKTLSAPLLATLAALVLTNAGVIPSSRYSLGMLIKPSHQTDISWIVQCMTS